MQLTRRAPRATTRELARTYRWATAWLIAGAILAVLLLANSIRDYQVVWRILAVQSVRHELSQRAVALEQRLRRAPASGQSPRDLLTEAAQDTADSLLWIELRRPEGGEVLARRGIPGARSFSTEDESAHFKSRQPLYGVFPASGGEAVIEVFPVYAPGLVSTSDATTPGSGPPRSLLVVEVAAPLAVADPSVIWPIRRNLAINSAGALALLATVVIAGLAFRTYVRGRRLELQVEIARQVQAELLPSGTEVFEPMRVAAVYRPAEQVSGDFYDVFEIGDDRMAIVLGDVSGKGVPAALVSGVMHGAVRSSAWSESASAHERESRRLNLLLCEKPSGGRYASMLWCYYEPATRFLSYVNAGHYPPFLIAGEGRPREVLRLDAGGGPVLGILPAARYEQARCEIRPGDVLVLYSDGLIEATNAAGEEYGEGRLRQLLASEEPASPGGVRDAVLASVRRFLGSSSARDDVTLVVAKFA